MSGITGYWTEGIWVDSCSACSEKKQRAVNLHFNHQEIRFCESCAVELREILAAMTKDLEPETRNDRLPRRRWANIAQCPPLAGGDCGGDRVVVRGVLRE